MFVPPLFIVGTLAMLSPGPWSDTALPPRQRAAFLLKEMNLTEKINYVHGGCSGYVFKKLMCSKGTSHRFLLLCDPLRSSYRTNSQEHAHFLRVHAREREITINSVCNAFFYFVIIINLFRHYQQLRLQQLWRSTVGRAKHDGDGWTARFPWGCWQIDSFSFRAHHRCLL